MVIQQKKIVLNNPKIKQMKNIFFVLCFLVTLSCKAQQQIFSINAGGWPIEGAYYKDLDNELNQFEGTWKGAFNYQIFNITFSKYKDYNSTGNYYEDRLAGKYKMLDANGILELYSTYNLPDNNAKVTSLGFVEGTNKTKLRLLFADNCIEGEIHISFENPQKTQMRWKYFTKQELVVDDSDCAPINEMPGGEFILTKQ
jgi:hypothetical protein